MSALVPQGCRRAVATSPFPADFIKSVPAPKLPPLPITSKLSSFPTPPNTPSFEHLQVLPLYASPHNYEPQLHPSPATQPPKKIPSRQKVLLARPIMDTEDPTHEPTHPGEEGHDAYLDEEEDLLREEEPLQETILQSSLCTQQLSVAERSMY
ncbi:hypothetical protein CBOM_06060 [Ceraceosorus bombacis]|uniref:Uncharacterized protein n=1 Tax=Ceraceosorus bombacis TaxID=401625 RepID=A0A0P1BJ96_9BASI|nr:hypothetical protein CBOM_06060 [Ceraceosorus bombacis]